MKPTQLGPLEGGKLNHRASKRKRLKWYETYSVGSLRRSKSLSLCLKEEKAKME
jgi:hypothetical protein